MNERELREQIAMHGKSLFDRGYSCGSSGNISVRMGSQTLVTPTNGCLGRLDPDRISKLDQNGNLLSGDKPSKESFLHLAMYRSRPHDVAIVHLHSTHSVAVSCLANLNTDDVLPPITAYYVMRVGKLPLVPYFAPGDMDLADHVERVAKEHRSVLLSNHGPVVASSDLDSAVNAIEELEETAKLFLMLESREIHTLEPEQIATLRSRFPS